MYNPHNVIDREIIRGARLRGGRPFDVGRSPRHASTPAFERGSCVGAGPQPSDTSNFRGRARSPAVASFVDVARLRTPLQRGADTAGCARCGRCR